MGQGFPEEMSLYEMLGVAKDASTGEIKKAYMRAAIRWHPDKNPGNPDAEEKFKQVNEAYHVLQDADKRKTYDLHGRAGLRAQEGGIDPMELFRMMFGAGKFERIFGDVTMFQGAADADRDQLPPEEAQARMMAQQKDKAEALAKQLVIKLEPFVRGGVADFRRLAAEDADDLVDSPGGPSLLLLIAYIYEQEAKQHMGRFFGIEGFFSKIAEKAHQVSSTVSAISDAVKLQSTLNQLQENEQNEQLQGKAMALGLSTIMKLGKLEIESTVRLVCELVLQERQVDKKTLKKRSKGLLLLAEIYEKIARKAEKDNRDADQPFSASNLEKAMHEGIKKQKEDDARKAAAGGAAAPAGAGAAPAGAPSPAASPHAAPAAAGAPPAKPAAAAPAASRPPPAAPTPAPAPAYTNVGDVD